MTPSIPTGLSISGKKVKLIAGGKQSTRLLGVGLELGQNHQFFRMDLGLVAKGHGGGYRGGLPSTKSNELAVWNDAPFHFHVMKY